MKRVRTFLNDNRATAKVVSQLLQNQIGDFKRALSQIEVGETRQPLEERKIILEAAHKDLLTLFQFFTSAPLV